MNNNYNYNNAIYKSNELIEACYNLTTSQNRILYLAMTKLETRIIDKNLNIKSVEDAILKSNFDLINIPVSLYKNVFNIKSNALYQELEKMAEELYDSEILYLDSKGSITKKRWVITCKYDKNQKGVSLQFHPDLIKDLLVFKSKYTKMIFDEFVDKINKKHSFRLYELCKQYARYGYRDFYVDDFRFKLALNDDEYSRFCDLKKYVIEQSIKEINKNTDMELRYEPIEKIKWTVNKFRIWIKKSNQQQLSLLDNPEIKPMTHDEEHIVKQLSALIQRDIKAGEAKNILTIALTAIDTIPVLQQSNIGVVDYINSKIPIATEYVEYKSQRGEPSNFIGALLTALKSNWQPSNVIIDTKNNKTLQFNDFEQREYDYDALEKQLLGEEEYDPDKFRK